jgi:hypothetical protein
MTSRLERTLSSLTDDELQLEVAPGRNRAYYILGHLTAFQDRLLHQLRLGERFHPELDDLFVTKPDRSFQDAFTGAEPFPPLSRLKLSTFRTGEGLCLCTAEVRHF